MYEALAYSASPIVSKCSRETFLYDWQTRKERKLGAENRRRGSAYAFCRAASIILRMTLGKASLSRTQSGTKR